MIEINPRDDCENYDDLWILLKDKIPETPTCIVTVRHITKYFDYDTCKQIGKTDDRNEIALGIYKKDNSWELEIGQPICDFWDRPNSLESFGYDMDFVNFPKNENAIEIDVVSGSGKKKRITRESLEIIAWFPFIWLPYGYEESEDSSE
jgi:hypothetical protein